MSTTTAEPKVNKDDAKPAKTIFFIRHAESEENRRLNCMKTIAKDLSKFSLPKSNDVSSAMSWFNIPAQLDSAVSERGKEQICEIAEILQRDNFIQRVELVAHSPLQRARDTCKGLLGCENPDIVVDPVQRVVSLDMLEELTPLEWTVTRPAFNRRLAQFEDWIHEQPEESIAIVGHSQFFKALLTLPFKFGNCDVWQVNFEGSGDTACKSNDEQKYKLPPKWSNLKKLYSCRPDVDTSSAE